jgi:ABC-2 type transport system ATP-binding protein
MIFPGRKRAAASADSGSGTAAPEPLAVHRLSKSFGACKALDGLSLTVARGEFLALLGPNGAGKTTLFQMLSGLFSADSGRAAIFGADIASKPTAALARLGIVFQQPAIDLDLTVQANLQFQADLHGIARAEARRRIAHWLARFGLAERARDPVRALSGGNRRRVELARALLTEPGLLLMDEATVGIDPASRQRILADVKDLCRERGLGVLWATHLVDEAEVADRILVLSKGRMCFDGSAVQMKMESGNANLIDAFLHLTR